MTYSQSNFNNKGCLFATWGIVVFIVIQEIAWIINGDWILAIIFPIICPLCLLGIPYGIIKLFIWLGPKEKYETKKNTHARA